MRGLGQNQMLREASSLMFHRDHFGYDGGEYLFSSVRRLHSSTFGYNIKLKANNSYGKKIYECKKKHKKLTGNMELQHQSAKPKLDQKLETAT